MSAELHMLVQCNQTHLLAVCSNRQANASSMESHSEELSRLRAENASLKQLLTNKDAQMAQSSVVNVSKDQLLVCKDELLAMKDELLVRRAADLQRCKQELLQYKTAHPEAEVPAADSS
jgi:hypothetical protein